MAFADARSLPDMESVDAEIYRSLQVRLTEVVATLTLAVDGRQRHHRRLGQQLRGCVPAHVAWLTPAVESDIFGEVQTTELKPGGSKIPVTEENKKVRASRNAPA